MDCIHSVKEVSCSVHTPSVASEVALADTEARTRTDLDPDHGSQTKHFVQVDRNQKAILGRFLALAVLGERGFLDEKGLLGWAISLVPLRTQGTPYCPSLVRLDSEAVEESLEGSRCSWETKARPRQISPSSSTPWSWLLSLQWDLT
jgi:hypothetical protein